MSTMTNELPEEPSVETDEDISVSELEDMMNGESGLTLLDRCDACSHAAAVSVAHKEGFEELKFCLHDGNIHRDALFDNGWILLDDERVIKTLTAKPE